MPISCQQCGWQNPEDANFCVNRTCGAYLEWEGHRAPGSAPDPVAPAQRPAPADPRAEVGRQRVGVRVAVADRTLSVQPGSTVTTAVTVHNSGTRVENFRLVVQGPAASWAALEPESVSVYPGSAAESTLRFAPPRTAAAPAGQAWYSLRAVSTVHPGLAAGVDGTLEVEPFRGLDAELVPRISRGRFGTVHTLRVTNQGNAVEPVALTAGDPETVLRFGLPAGELPVQPGTEQFDIPVRAPFRLIGRAAQPYPFQLVITPRSTLPPLRLDGTREVVPLAPRWAPILAAVVLLLALLAPFVPRLLTTSAASEPALAQQPTLAPTTQAPEATAEAETAEETEAAGEPEEETAEPPPPTPDPLPPDPPPPPPVHAEGEFEIRQTFRADLDEGLETGDGADIWFQAETATERFITPWAPGVMLAALGDVEPSFEQCSDAPLSTDRIPIQDLPVGSIVCLLTDEERLSVVVVEDPPGPSPGVLRISFTTYAN